MSEIKIQRAAVLGAGVMGAQIAAHLAAAGVRTHLLDLPSSEGPKDPKLQKAVGKNIRNTRAILAIEQLKMLKPSPLMTPSVTDLLIPGNFEDDMPVLADVDWVIEAVVERRDIKQSIHKRIAEVVPGHIPITTNTSGISVGEMAQNFPEHLAKNFFGTHFFNPPRYLHLVEVIPHQNTDTDLMERLSRWTEERLGKGVVFAKDTINFIGNRIGVYNLQVTIKHMTDLGLSIETVDALTGKLMGRPASATFRTLDVVGLDTYAHTARNVYDGCKDDPYLSDFAPVPWLEELITQGALGQKAGSVGCYKKDKGSRGKTSILAYRPQSKTYIEQEDIKISWLAEASKMQQVEKRLAFVFEQKDPAADFVWRVLRDTFVYAAAMVEDIADGLPQSVDDAIRWGFNWQLGPFELWQAIGYERIRERMIAEDCRVPNWCGKDAKFYRPEPQSAEWHMQGADYQIDALTGKSRAIERPKHVIKLPRFDSQQDNRRVLSNAGMTLLDIGDGVACLSFHSKMNTLNDDILSLSQKAVQTVSADFDALVIANDGEHFSAGADIRGFLQLIDKQDFNGIDQMLRQFQGTMQLIKFAPFPSVSTPHHLTLGGGCEFSMHASRQLIHSECYAGLVEIGVGVIPAGGGTKELALRSYAQAKQSDGADPMAFIKRAFQLIGTGKVSSSGFEAVEMGLYPESAEICMSQAHLCAKAKSWARHLVEMGYKPQIPASKVAVAGDPGIQTIKLGLYNMKESGFITDYEYVIGEGIATVLCGGAVHGGTLLSEEDFLNLERQVFVDLCRRPQTRERIEHMLKTGKVLRN